MSNELPSPVSEDTTVPSVSEDIPSSSSSNQPESSPETITQNEAGTNKRNLSDDSFIEELNKRPNLNSWTTFSPQTPFKNLLVM